MLVAVAVILLATVMFRAVGVAEDCITRDEAFSWRLIQYPVPELLSRTGQDVHPPLYYLLLKAWSALCGRSLLALRAMSVGLAAGTIPVLVAAVGEFGRQNDRQDTAIGSRLTLGGLLAAILFAVHTSQLYPGRDARMYPLGVFLAVLTSWLLLRALRAVGGSLRWWIAYGIAVALFCYTHNYAFFTVAGQSLFVLGTVARKMVGKQRHEADRVGEGFLFAGSLALALYLPWIPVLFGQIHEVRASYWIREMDWAEIQRVIAAWGGGATVFPHHAGSEYVTQFDVNAWLIAIGLLVLVAVVTRDRGMWFFLLQAATPWGLAWGLSALGDRAILHERYLALSQVSLLACWGVVFDRLPHIVSRAMIAWFLTVTVLYNSALAATQISWDTPPGARALRFVSERYNGETDVIIASSYAVVNQVAYYASEAGIATAKVMALDVPQGRVGHVTHIASLRADHILPEEDLQASQYDQIWYVSGSGGAYRMPRMSDLEVIARTEFLHEDGRATSRYHTDYFVTLFGKKESY